MHYTLNSRSPALMIGIIATIAAISPSLTTAKPPSEKDIRKVATETADIPKSELLFDGKTLTGWKKTSFGGEGEIKVEDGRIVMEMGNPMTGITLQKKFPKTNYELTLKAMKLDGIDFFCAITFPVEDSFCTFVVGGWAGACVGLSSIDGYDASMNDTTKYEAFKTNQWYEIRLRVVGKRIQTWIDKKQFVDFDATKHKLSTRPEVDANKPFGISNYVTVSALKEIRVKKLDPKKKTKVSSEKSMKK